ncbi:MAG: metallopeptidase family protein [Candidatus Omnitrophica bacterium]|nr:metallopeptidase family protein [Candidatus Omnitrophota bacterium]MCM8777604.1 metallopeptidase family protein [Candidatus Omnitrophota bacterium]
MIYYKNMKITKTEFEEIMAEKFDKLPDIIKTRLENVEFFVEESDAPYLLGLYHGIPFPKRKNPGYSLVMPDKIILFKGSIEKGCRTREELEEKIEKVLFHEIGHYLGLDEDQLKKLNL